MAPRTAPPPGNISERDLKLSRERGAGGVGGGVKARTGGGKDTVLGNQEQSFRSPHPYKVNKGRAL